MQPLDRQSLLVRSLVAAYPAQPLEVLTEYVKSLDSMQQKAVLASNLIAPIARRLRRHG